MARSAKRSPASIRFKHPVEVTAQRAEFELFDAVSHFDVAALERARRAKLEIGVVRTECGRQLVRAVIRKGEVTELKIEPCEEGGKQPLPAEFAPLLKTALRRIAPGSDRRPTFPIPVAKFMANAAAISVDVLICVRICIGSFCVTCCRVEGRKDVICGKVTIDTTKPG